MILKSVALTKVAENILRLMRTKTTDFQSALKENGKAIIGCWSDMILHINETVGPNALVHTQDGLPKEAEQCVMAQHGTMELTIDLLKLILGASQDCLQKGICRRTIMVLFRYLQLLVKESLSNGAALETHKAFIYQHINSDYQVWTTAPADVLINSDISCCR